MNAQERDLMAAHGAPTWTFTTAERLVEAAATIEPERMYEAALSMAATGSTRSPRPFARLINSGIMCYVVDDPSARPTGGSKNMLQFTEAGLDYCIDVIGDRVGQLAIARKQLIVIRNAAEAE